MPESTLMTLRTLLGIPDDSRDALLTQLGSWNILALPAPTTSRGFCRMWVCWWQASVSATTEARSLAPATCWVARLSRQRASPGTSWPTCGRGTCACGIVTWRFMPVTASGMTQVGRSGRIPRMVAIPTSAPSRRTMTGQSRSITWCGRRYK